MSAGFFLFDLLEVLKFPHRMIKWIKACVTTPRFSINLNGESVGYFVGAKGLRQGDPLSPYLFVLTMEALNQLLKFNISKDEKFKFHWRCDKLHISHLCFADDLMILFYGNTDSANVIKKTILDFSEFIWLTTNNAKSCIFMAGIDNEVEAEAIRNVFQFQTGELPIKYLCVPLISTRLKKSDCSDLILRITKRVQSWTSKILSYAGKLQLLQSVIMGIHNYWAGMFILP